MLLLDHSCTVARNQAVGTNGRKAYATVAINVPCLALPMSAQAAIENGFSVGSSYDVYFSDGADIQTGDKLTVNGGVLFVRGRQPFTGLLAPVSHLHVMATTEGANG